MCKLSETTLNTTHYFRHTIWKLGFLFLLTNQSSPLWAQESNFWDKLRKEDTAIHIPEIREKEFFKNPNCVEARLEVVLDSLAMISRNAKRIQGYRVLIYSGNSRDEATKAKEHAYKILPNIDLYTSYLSPTFKVKLGDFYQRIDAFLTLKKLAAVFPSAVIVEEVVKLKF